jgi:hypothetical protein
MNNKENTSEREIVIGGVYRHFKGNFYKVLTLALDSETLEEKVIYISLYYNPEKETRVWSRSLEDFLGPKELEDGKIVNRFDFISEK